MPPKKAVTKPAGRGVAPVRKAPVKTAAPAKGGAKKPGVPVGKGKTPPAKGKENQPSKPVKKQPTKQDLAAVVIQKWVRRFLAKIALQKQKKEKENYEELMEQLEREGGHIGFSPPTLRSTITSDISQPPVITINSEISLPPATSHH
ncbi:uncharacterized protein LOC102805508 [Saccoglossus kowalevskii]|uniref:Uncharacterized protein LOC102805508 n=1 Tax=Saccoglossus kowalevskii TaxID=10224 RepID=A0ABM0M7P1_SACKO|nr:PREDICTED: uncharacterized protein LOC102805508 [Saccoglossus kowalevskii]